MTHELAYTRGRVLVDYGREVEEEIARLQTLIEETPALTERWSSRWLALKLLEEDSDIIARLQDLTGGAAVISRAEDSIKHLRSIYGDDVDTIIADRRYGFISGLIKEVVTRPAIDRVTLSDQIDKIVTNRILGIPIFLVLMWIVFEMTANVSGAYLDWVDMVISGPITNWTVALLGFVNLGGTWLESLVVDGIIAGVGGVLVFVPVLLFLYFFIAILEDSGYMARAAFVMDRLMHLLGLHGKSFLPMLVGFGCNVPGIYATRTLENRQDRILTGLLVPFMSCAARLPVYVLFAAAFFPNNTGQVILSMYVIGIVVAIITGMVFKRTLFRGKEESPFVMELPPYRVPTARGVLLHMWERTYAFVRKAWTIIMVTSIIVWVLLSVPLGVENPRDSLFGQVSAAVAPVFAPAGYGSWEPTGALVTGFVAKEVVVGTLSEAYAVGAEGEGDGEPTPTFLEDVQEIVIGFWNATVDTVKGAISIIPGIDLMGAAEEDEVDKGLVTALQGSFKTPLAAFAYLIFILFYTPCMVVVAAQWQEYGWKWTLFSAGYLLVFAWVASVIVYQGGLLLGLG